MIRLCIGISSLTPGWKSLFDQLGINVEEIDFSSNISTRYSCLIINSKLDQDFQKRIYRFIKNENGGVILTKNSKTLFSKDRSTTNLKIDLPQGYRDSVHSYYLGNGLIFSLGFDPDTEFAINDYRRSRFPFKRGYHPDELVSCIDKESLRQTIEILLKELHYNRGLPYTYKWISPSKKPYFGFRIDTDFGTQESVQDLHDLANFFKIPMTWFLHVQAHEDWLKYFHSFKKQEIALHGHEHGTSTSFEHVINNIERGKQLMVDAGLKPDGFCVPYSIWNETLGEVLNNFEFKYSSEFTIGYDTVPFYPIHKGKQHNTLQIPIHPICTGSLNRKKISVDEMTEYFDNVLWKKADANQNVIFYHHPLQPGLNIWNTIFKKVNELGLTKLTFSQIADFWNERLNSHIEIYFDKESSTLNCDSSNSNLFLNISMNSKSYHLIKASKVNQPLDSFEEFLSPEIPSLSKEVIDELNRNRIQLIKTSILDWKNRIKL